MKSFKTFLSSPRVVSAAIILLALVLRLPGLNKSLWLDEASTVSLVLAPDFWSTLRGYDHPPLYFLILKAWAALFGSSEWILRLPSVLFSLGALWVLLAWLVPLSRRGGLLAGLLWASQPVLLRFSQEVRGYSLLLFWTVLAFYCIARLSAEPKRWLLYAGLGLALAGAVLTHLVGVMLLPALGIFLLAQTFGRWKSLRWGGVLAAFGLPALVFFALYAFFFTGLSSRTAGSWGDASLRLELLLATAFYLSGGLSFVQPLPAVNSWFSLPLSVLCGAVCIVVGVNCLFGNWRKNWSYFLAAFLYEACLVGYSLVSGVVIFGERTALPGLVPMLAFAVFQWETPRQEKIQRLSRAGILLLAASGLCNWLSYSAPTPLEAWRELGSQLSGEWQPGDLLLVYPTYADVALAYYAPRIPRQEMQLIPVEAGPERLPAIQKRLDQSTGRVFLLTRLDARTVQDDGLLSQIELAVAQRGRPLVPLFQQGCLTLSGN